ncbi:MAG: hypothetical protein IKE18_11270 [Oscillospiraceae bacterium]|nr:hypothetical protein [Oscillospiraceae bacterium]
MDQKNYGGQEYNPLPKWVTLKLILGILSIIVSIFVLFQSCVAGLGNALEANGESGGFFGALVAFNLLASGVIAIAARRSEKKTAMIIAAALLWLSYFFGKIFSGSFGDLVIWGFLSYAIGVVYLFSVMTNKKQYIITAVIAALYLAIALI